MTRNCVAAKKRLALVHPVALSVALVGLLVGTLPSAASAATRQKMSTGLTSKVESARRQAEILSRTQKHDEALEVLRSARAGATPADIAYWQLYGDLAWERESKPEAMLAYRIVWEAGSSNALAMERLIQQYNANGQPQLAIAVGKKGYQR
ncbi:MAG: tetratricopeptide repeat protein, partial [Polaromonas sp.]